MARREVGNQTKNAEFFTKNHPNPHPDAGPPVGAAASGVDEFRVNLDQGREVGLGWLGEDLGDRVA